MLALTAPSVTAWHSWNSCVCHKARLCNATGWHGWATIALEHYKDDIVPKIRRFYEDPLPEPLARLRTAASTSSASAAWPRVIHQTWKTRKLPEGMRELADSWRTHHPRWEYRLWTDDDNRRLVADHYPWFLATYDAYDHPIKRVDAARVFMLHRYGGIYSDLDSACLRSFDELVDAHPQASVLLGFVGPKAQFQSNYAENVPNALMVSKPGARFWVEVMVELYRRLNCAKPEYDTGPGLITDVAKAHARAARSSGNGAASGVTMLNSSFFYPIDWSSKHWHRMSYNERRTAMGRAANGSRCTDAISKASGVALGGAFAAQFWTHTWSWGR